MKMLYRPSKRPTPTFLIWGIIAFIFIIILMTTGMGNFASRVTVASARPFWKLGNYLGDNFNSLTAFLSSKKTLAEENRAWQREVAKLRLVALRQKELEEENEELRAILGREKSEQLPLFAKVLTRPNQSPYDILLVDLGADNTNKPIKAGDRVMVTEDLIIGEVSAVYGKTAKLSLFSSPGNERAVFVGPNNIPALAKGLGGGNFLLNLPRSLEVKENDLVKTNFGGNLWLMGIITRIKNSPSDAFQEINFKNPANIYEVGSVEVYHD